MRFILIRAAEAAALAATAQWSAKLLRPGQLLNWPDLDADCCFVIPLPESSAAFPLMHDAETSVHVESSET